jgi:hypothetical protein
MTYAILVVVVILVLSGLKIRSLLLRCDRQRQIIEHRHFLERKSFWRVLKETW